MPSIEQLGRLFCLGLTQSLAFASHDCRQVLALGGEGLDLAGQTGQGRGVGPVRLAQKGILHGFSRLCLRTGLSAGENPNTIDSK